MSLITKETIDRIFETARIEEVIGEFVHLKRAGSNYKGLSPFNNEKSPSFMVSPAKQIFKDFSSGKGGSVVTFLMELENYTYPEALRWLAKKYNIEIEEDAQRTPEQDEANNEREAIYLISEFAQKFYAEQLQTDEGKRLGLSYFRERGFTDETVEKFGLGYAPLQKDVFAKTALEKGYSADVLLASGISLQREDKGWYRRKEKTREGSLSGLFIIIVFTLRIFHEMLKEGEVVYSNELFSITNAQMLSIPVIIVGIIFYCWNFKKNNDSI